MQNVCKRVIADSYHECKRVIGENSHAHHAVQKEYKRVNADYSHAGGRNVKSRTIMHVECYTSMDNKFIDNLMDNLLSLQIFLISVTKCLDFLRILLCRSLDLSDLTIWITDKSVRPSFMNGFYRRYLLRHSCHRQRVPLGDSASMLEMLPSYLLEDICSNLPHSDVCRLAQVNKYCYYKFTKDGFWKQRAIEKDISKALEDQNWKFNFMVSESKLLLARLQEDSPAVYFKGAITFIDPFKVFFKTNEKLLQLLRRIVTLGHKQLMTLVVTYRGYHSVIVTASQWDSDTAFEISRGGVELGCDEVDSKCIAVVPNDLIDLLLEENGETVLEGGVTVSDVDGKVVCSNDGDFFISRPTPSPQSLNISKYIEEDVKEHVDLLCAAGGSWTFLDDSSSDEDDDDDIRRHISYEELQRVLAEDGDVESDED